MVGDGVGGVVLLFCFVPGNAKGRRWEPAASGRSLDLAVGAYPEDPQLPRGRPTQFIVRRLLMTAHVSAAAVPACAHEEPEKPDATGITGRIAIEAKCEGAWERAGMRMMFGSLLADCFIAHSPFMSADPRESGPSVANCVVCRQVIYCQCPSDA